MRFYELQVQSVPLVIDRIKHINLIQLLPPRKWASIASKSYHIFHSEKAYHIC